MKILALEFSSPRRSVAVLNGRGAAAYEVAETAPGNTMQPFAMIEAALHQAGLDREQIECLAVGLGPGSYTGIRAAIALAQGWQLARGVKLLGVSSAECIAAQSQADGITGNCSVVIDAQRGEFYRAGYALSKTAIRETTPLHLTSLEAIRDRAQAGEMFIGPEATRWIADGLPTCPSATALGRLVLTRANFVSGEKIEPIYLRETTFVKAPSPRLIQ